MEQVQLRFLYVADNACIVPFEAGGRDIALRRAAIGGVDDAEARDVAGFNCAQRDLVGSNPVIFVANEAKAQLRVAERLRVLQIDDVLVEPGGQVERAVAALVARCNKKCALADLP